MAGIVTLLLDGFKGWFAVWPRVTRLAAPVLWMSFAALAVLCDTRFPSFLGSKAERQSQASSGLSLSLRLLPCRAVILIFVFLTATTRYLFLWSVAAVLPSLAG